MIPGSVFSCDGTEGDSDGVAVAAPWGVFHVPETEEGASSRAKTVDAERRAATASDPA